MDNQKFGRFIRDLRKKSKHDTKGIRRKIKCNR